MLNFEHTKRSKKTEKEVSFSHLASLIVHVQCVRVSVRVVCVFVCSRVRACVCVCGVFFLSFCLSFVRVTDGMY